MLLWPALALIALVALGCTPTDPMNMTVVCGGRGLVCCVPPTSTLDGGVFDAYGLSTSSAQERLDGGPITSPCDPGLACAPDATGNPPRCEPCLSGIACGGRCVNSLSDDPNNCGTCGVVCASGTACTSGTCTTSCIASETICMEQGVAVCRDLSMEDDNCGSCGNECPAGTTCSGGFCAVTCGEGLTNCAGHCVDLQTDHGNCGSCGMACPDLLVCAAGSCWHSCGAGLVTCPPSTTMPLPYCADTASDLMNCGRCGSACAIANAVNDCVDGQCVIEQCASGFSGCGQMATNGCNIDLMTDAANCGACGNACGAGLVCIGGSCGPTTQQPSCPVAGELGCGQVSIPGSAFTMGGDPQSGGGGTVAGVMTISPFVLDAYEVTVARFRRFANAGFPVPTNVTSYPGGSTTWGGPIPMNQPLTTMNCTWTAAPGAWEAHPITGVTWWAAQAFCVWDGGRLPTEAEWEYAARGTSLDGLTPERTYPWGNRAPIPSCGMEFHRGPLPLAQFNNCPGEDGTVTTRVGRFAPSAGLYDLAGNAWEWTADWYAPYGAATCWGGASRMNPICNHYAYGGARIVRGGSYNDNDLAGSTNNLRSASRRIFSGPADALSIIGFRCARGVL